MKKPFPDVIFELKFSVGQYFSLFIKWGLCTDDISSAFFNCGVIFFCVQYTLFVYHKN